MQGGGGPGEPVGGTEGGGDRIGGLSGLLGAMGGIGGLSPEVLGSIGGMVPGILESLGALGGIGGTARMGGLERLQGLEALGVLQGLGGGLIDTKAVTRRHAIDLLLNEFLSKADIGDASITAIVQKGLYDVLLVEFGDEGVVLANLREVLSTSEYLR